MSIFIINTEICCANFLGHCFHVSRDQLALAVIHQIADVTGPTAKVSRSLSIVVIVRDIHRTKHMGKLYRLTIRSLKSSNSTQGLSSCSIGSVLIGHIGDKCRIFCTCKNCPAVRVVFFNASSDIIYNQFGSV